MMFNYIYDKIKEFMKGSIGLLIFIAIFFFLTFVDLPYDVNMPGGLISLNDRIEVNGEKIETKGTFNMAYVSSISGSLPHVLLSFIIPDWDITPTSESTYENETYEDAFKSFATNKVWNHDGEQKTAPAVHFMYVDYDREEDKGEKQADAYFKLLDEYDFEELIQLAYLDTPNDVLGIQPSDSDWVGEDAKVRIPTPTIAYYTADGATNAIMGLEGNETPERANYIRDFYYGLNDWDL